MNIPYQTNDRLWLWTKGKNLVNVGISTLVTCVVLSTLWLCGIMYHRVMYIFARWFTPVNKLKVISCSIAVVVNYTMQVYRLKRIEIIFNSMDTILQNRKFPFLHIFHYTCTSLRHFLWMPWAHTFYLFSYNSKSILQ